MRTPGGVAAGEEQAVDALRRAGPRRPRRRRPAACITFGGTPAAVQQARDVQPRQRGVFRRLVEHGVAGQQRRHDDVAADEVRIVPGRDVGHHAERHVRDLLVHAAVVEHMLVAHRGLDLFDEEIDARQQAVELVARLADRLADLLASGCGPAFPARRRPAGAKALRSRPGARPAASPPSPAARRARPRPWPPPMPASSAGEFGDLLAGGGVDGSLRVAVMALRRGACRVEEVVQDRRVVDQRAVGRVVKFGMPLHRRDEARRRAQRIGLDHAVVGATRLDPKPGARSLMPWWCTLLTVARGTPG